MKYLWTLAGAAVGWVIGSIPYFFIDWLVRRLPFLRTADWAFKAWFILIPLLVGFAVRKNNKELSNGFFLSFLIILAYLGWQVKKYGF